MISRNQAEGSLTVVFVIPKAGMNGHTFHALDIGNALIDAGNDVIAVMSPNIYRRDIHGFRGRIIGVPENELGRRSGSKVVIDLLKSESIVPNVIQTWYPTGVACGLAVARAFSCGFVASSCLGTKPNLVRLDTPIANHMTVLLTDYAADLERRFRILRPNVAVAYQRIRPPDSPEISRGLLKPVMAELGWPDQTQLVLRVARVDENYVDSIVEAIELTSALRRAKNIDARFLHVGRLSDDENYQSPASRLACAIGKANSEAGEVIAASTQSIREVGFRLAPAASLVVASDKPAFEGLMAGVPLVACARGSGKVQALVDESNIDEFAGSNFAKALSNPKSLDQIIDRCSEVMTDPAARDAYCSWARQWSMDNTSVDIGANIHLENYRKALLQVPSRYLVVREMARRGLLKVAVRPRAWVARSGIRRRGNIDGVS